MYGRANQGEYKYSEKNSTGRYNDFRRDGKPRALARAWGGTRWAIVVDNRRNWPAVARPCRGQEGVIDYSLRFLLLQGALFIT